MKQWIMRFWATAAAVFALFAAAAHAEDSVFDMVKKRGTLVAGVKNDYPPAGYVDRNGDWVGIDVDLAKYIAQKLGVALKMEPVTSRTRIPMLVNGNVDLIININPTRERAQTVDFTIPYFLAGTTFLVYRNSGIHGPQDAAAPRKTGSVQGSADGPGLLAVQPKADLVYFQEFPQAFLALKQRRIDAMITSSVTLLDLSKNEPDMVVIDPPFKPDPWAIGVRQNDSKWRLFLTETIMDAWTDGTIGKLHQKYIGQPVSFKVDVWPDYYQK